jgi:hypothetical protein
MKAGKSASETTAPLTLVYGEYAMKKWSAFNGIGGSRKDDKMRTITQAVGSQKHKGQMQM